MIDPRVDEDVSRALLESGIDPALLELELTESSLMQNTEATISTRLASRAGASNCRSMTSGPAIRVWPTCSGSRSTK